MRSVGLKVLNNKLSEYVRLAAGGETGLVTDRDRVVAQMEPPQPGPQPNPSERSVGRGSPSGIRTTEWRSPIIQTTAPRLVTHSRFGMVPSDVDAPLRLASHEDHKFRAAACLRA